MARAKRTVRADARRRYRQEQGIVEEPIDEPSDPAPRAPVASSVARSTVGPTPSARLGITEAFRRSFRPLDVRGDLAALPTLIRSKAFWLPSLLTIASTGLVFATRGTDVVSAFLYAYFIQTPAIGAVFIAGFLAPRASWLLGILVGLISAACYTAIGVSGMVSVPQGTDATQIVTASFLLSPIMGALFAAAAAWYRRFLQLSNPNRGRQRPGQRAVPRSTGDGRTRAARSKAPVRR